MTDALSAGLRLDDLFSSTFHPRKHFYIPSTQEKLPWCAQKLLMLWIGRFTSGTIGMSFRMRLQGPRNDNGTWTDGHDSVSTVIKFRGTLDGLLHREPKPLKATRTSQVSILSADVFMAIMLLCLGSTNGHFWQHSTQSSAHVSSDESCGW